MKEGVISCEKKESYPEQKADGEEILLQYLEQRGLANQRGIAVAVNQEIIPKTLWSEKKISKGDSILIIQATQGG